MNLIAHGVLQKILGLTKNGTLPLKQNKMIQITIRPFMLSHSQFTIHLLVLMRHQRLKKTNSWTPQLVELAELKNLISLVAKRNPFLTLGTCIAMMLFQQLLIGET